MRVTVTTLRKNGLRLARNEWPAPVAGELRIGDRAPETTSYKRFVRMAELWEPGAQTSRPLLPPLADPQILKTADGGFILGGIELDPRDGRIAEHWQLWLCMPRGA